MRSRATWHAMRRGIGAIAGAALLAIGAPMTSAAAFGTNDYPYRGTVNVLDRWGFYSGYCTSFAAWRLSQEGFVMHGAVLRGPNGRTAFFGNGGSWDAAARSIGFSVDTRPAPGAIAVWHGGEGGAWWGGHVAFVLSVDGAGRARVEEYNWSVRNGYDQRTVIAPRYIHFTGAGSQPVSYVTHTYRTTDVLRMRSGPGTSFASVGTLASGATIQIVCQVRSSSSVNGSTMWDRLNNGSYVSDYYTTTPVYNNFSPGIAHC